MKYLIDSDWVVDYLKGVSHADILLNSLEPEGLAISIITFGEVLEGVIFSQNRAKHEVGFRRFLRRAQVLPISGALAVALLGSVATSVAKAS